MKANAETLGALYISGFLQKEKNTNIIKAYRRISFVCYVKNKIGYIKRVNCEKTANINVKKIKLLHDSLSFL
mgnify:CR=1 FL=1